jgi:integrase
MGFVREIVLMAYLEKEKRKSGWVIRIKQLGLDTSYQTRRQKKNEAKAILTRVQKNIDSVKSGELNFEDNWSGGDRLQFLIHGKVPQYEIPSQTDVRLKDAIARYINHHRSIGSAHNTIVGYRLDLNTAKSHFGDIALKNITKKNLQDWVHSQGKTKIALGKHRGELTDPKTIKKRVQGLQRLMNWLFSFEEIAKDPKQLFANINYPKKETKWDILTWEPLSERRKTLQKLGLPDNERRAFEKVFFNTTEAATLLQLLNQSLYVDGTKEGRRLFVALTFAAYTASRRSEICRVQIQDVDFEDNTVRLIVKKGRGQAAFRQHTFPLHNELVKFLKDHIAELPSGQRCLFTNDDNHLVDGIFDDAATRHKADWLGKQLKNALTGTEFELCSGWHIYRHSLATMLANNCEDVETVMQIIGHKNEAIHRLYRHNQDTATAHRAIGDITLEKGTERVQNPA